MGFCSEYGKELYFYLRKEIKMSEPFIGNEMSEDLESQENLEALNRDLTEMTHEPGSYIEGQVETEYSETIEITFTNVVDNALESPDSISGRGGDISSDLADPNELAEVIPLPLPMPVDQSDVSGGEETQIPALDGSSKTASDLTGIEEIGNLPIPLPIDPPETVNEGGIPVIEVQVNGEVPANYDGNTITVTEGSDLTSINPDPIYMDPDPILSESGAERSDPNEEVGLIGENG
jgi:hypothetical protein